MRALKLIAENGIESGMDLIVSEYNLDGYVSAGEIIRVEFSKCDDLEALKPFALVMDEHYHICDIEPKMIDLMGDEFFDWIDSK